MTLIKRAVLIMALAGISALPVFADSFTSSSSFNTAISGMSGVTTANFDSDPVGDIAQGGTVDGITFTYNINGGAGSLAIVNLFDTTSGTNYLGSDDPTTGALFPGDSVTMTFSSDVNALGFFIISAGPYSAGDFTLTSSTATATNSSSVETSLPDGGQVIFLGITSTTGFNSATITLGPGAFELGNMDDITTAEGTPNSGGGGTTPAPEPETWALLAAGLALCALRAWKTRSAQTQLLD